MGVRQLKKIYLCPDPEDYNRILAANNEQSRCNIEQNESNQDEGKVDGESNQDEGKVDGESLNATKDASAMLEEDDAATIVEDDITSENDSSSEDEGVVDMFPNGKIQSLNTFNKAPLNNFNVYKQLPACSKTLPPLEGFYYKLPFKVLESEKAQADFWEKSDAKFNEDLDFTEEEIEEELQANIEDTIDYFERYSKGELTEEEQKKQSAKERYGPYLPNDHDLEALQNLKIENKFENGVPEWYDDRFHILSCRQTHFPNIYPPVVRLKWKPKKGLFTQRETECVLKNWREFQKEYKFHDIRPLLSIRTLYLEGSVEHFHYGKFHYVSPKQQADFIIYLTEGLLDREPFQVYSHLCTFLLPKVLGIAPVLTMRIRHTIAYFLKNIGVSTRILDFLLPSNSKSALDGHIENYFRFRKFPIRYGKFSAKEIILLVDAVMRLTKDLSDLPNYKARGCERGPVQWNKVTEVVRTRMPYQCKQKFNDLVKQALYMKKQVMMNKDKKVQWTSKLELLLAHQLVKSSADHLCRVDFFAMTKLEEFAPFCDYYLSRMARELICHRVPVSKRRNLDDSLEYLHAFVLPAMEEKVEKHNKVLKSSYLLKSDKLRGKIPEYLDKYIIKMFEAPLHDEEEVDAFFEDVNDSTIEDVDGCPDDEHEEQEMKYDPDCDETARAVSVDEIEGSGAASPHFTKLKKKKKNKRHSEANQTILLEEGSTLLEDNVCTKKKKKRRREDCKADQEDQSIVQCDNTTLSSKKKKRRREDCKVDQEDQFDQSIAQCDNTSLSSKLSKNERRKKKLKPHRNGKECVSATAPLKKKRRVDVVSTITLDSDDGCSAPPEAPPAVEIIDIS